MDVRAIEILFRDLDTKHSAGIGGMGGGLHQLLIY